MACEDFLRPFFFPHYSPCPFSYSVNVFAKLRLEILPRIGVDFVMVDDDVPFRKLKLQFYVAKGSPIVEIRQDLF